MDFAFEDVAIRDFPETPVAVLTHAGDPKGIPETVERFIAWRRSAGLCRQVSATYTVFPVDPRVTPPAAFRLDLCAAADAVLPNEAGVVPGAIPGGRCAVLRVIGPMEGDGLERAALFLHRNWLPRSGARLRAAPLFCRRVSFPPDVPADEAVTDLYLPLM